MENWRVMEELEFLEEWDPDAICDVLNITSVELLNVPSFQARAIRWIEENN